MNKNMNSPTKLTEFAPLSPEESQPVVASLFSKFFNFTRGNQNSEGPATTPNDEDASPSSTGSASWNNSESTSKSGADDKTSVMNYPMDNTEGRSLPNVLKRISNIVASKSNNLQSYKDSQLRSYWMPDNVSKECYECNERFTTFRRRHHCRVCGQIFCSKCCSDEIPGKIMGVTGDLRVCTYCCKVVLSYLQSSDMRSDLSADLKALQEDLQIKYGSESPPAVRKTTTDQDEDEVPAYRKPSVGYMEEKYALRRSSSTYLTSQERSMVLKNSASLRMIYEELFKSSQAIPLQTHRILLKSYNNCFLGNELVNWMIAQNKAATRVQAIAIGQALFEAGFIESPTAEKSFSDSTAIFKPVDLSHDVRTTDFLTGRQTSCDAQEPAWVKTIPQHDSTTDSESETKQPEALSLTAGRLPSSSSSFYLDLNLEASTVTLKRPTSEDLISVITDSSDKSSESAKEIKAHDCSTKETEELREQKLEVQEFKGRNGWHKATNLRNTDGEMSAYNSITLAYKEHGDSLIKQLLSREGLSLSWSDVILKIANEIVDHVRPDLSHNAEDLDIRHYVQIKKSSGGTKNDCEIIPGVICTKNVAHRSMDAMIPNPKILLLKCGLMYQRVEGKLLSLEPIMLQESEYLGHTVARITALGPDIVLVHRSVSRLAQDRLRECGITLVLNVKLSVLERVSRCTGATIVNTIDAHINARNQLGTCNKFYMRNFPDGSTGTKTYMFFEGCINSHLGMSVLLRGGSLSELKKVKSVTSTMIFAAYSWRLEMSFLMDEFCRPPPSKDNSFLDEDNLSPPQIEHKKESDCDEVKKAEQDVVLRCVDGNWEMDKVKLSSEKKSTDEKRTYGESIIDQSDPLHQYLNQEDEIRDEALNANAKLSPHDQALSVADLPLLNKFKKALEGTTLSVSPYLKFHPPYLDTELGRNCVLRRFFSRDLYYSVYFLDNVKTNKSTTNQDPAESSNVNQMHKLNLKEQHPFVEAKLTSSVDSKETSALLSNFRACGSRLHFPNGLTNEKNTSDHEETNANPIAASAEETAENSETLIPLLDCLDPANHQRLSVLFCSFAHSTNAAPAFCVNPWVVNMDLYGRNDISLGRFLERYCLTTEYKCPAQSCRAQIAQHGRRFAHDGGCIHINLSEVRYEPFEKNENSNDILTWSKCSKCNSTTPVVPMSQDTWSLSFAKYLELKFHGYVYTRRDDVACQHSLHHDHLQYFTKKNMLAIFKYNKISQWEISLPPPFISIMYDSKQQANVLEEIKSLAYKGDEVFSSVREKLSTLLEPEAMNLAKQQLAKEQQYFKTKIEEIQLKLTSPTLENKKLEGKTSERAVQALMFRIEDGIVISKRLIAEAVMNWNSRILEAMASNEKKKKEEKAKSKNAEKAEKVESSGTTNDAASTVFEDAPSTEFQAEDLSPASADYFAIDAVSVVHQDNSCQAADVVESSDYETTEPDNLGVHGSPKTHTRSDAFPTSTATFEDNPDKKKKKKTILSQLLPSMSNNTPITSPLGSLEHHLLPLGSVVPIVVYESEPSSIIAYALDTHDYKHALQELIRGNKPTDATQSPSIKRKILDSTKESQSELQSSGELKRPSVLSFLRVNSPSMSSPSADVDKAPVFDSPNANHASSINESEEDKKNQKQQNYIQVQFNDTTTSFYCRVYYAAQFMSLRDKILTCGEDGYTRSLSRSVIWAARGGKSGSAFCKTKDDRFILKEMSRLEMQIFLDFAPNYFAYMEKCQQSKRPTLLGKIVGIYRVSFKNNTTNAALRTSLLVMENLFYKRSITDKFDLKGSVRNRLVNPEEAVQEGELVLLDENLLNMSCDSPLYIRPHSKVILNEAIEQDTKFLAANSVMDYSLLVGLEPNSEELVLGIIDYIRTFTWDKKLETMVKKSGILGGQGKLPTIISPEEYRERFIAAMHRYFLPVPDRWHGLDRGT